MSTGVKCLHLTIIGPFVGNIECGFYRTSIRILAARIQQLFIQFPIQIIDTIVECEHHQLGNLFVGKISGNIRPTTTAIGQSALFLIALGCSDQSFRLWIQWFRSRSNLYRFTSVRILDHQASFGWSWLVAQINQRFTKQTISVIRNRLVLTWWCW